MSLFDIYKAKKLGINTASMFASIIGKKIEEADYWKHFNKWDEEWELGYYTGSNGNKAAATNQIRTKNFIQVIPDTDYYIKSPQLSNKIFYDSEHGYISDSGWTNGVFKTPANAHYITVSFGSSYGTTYKNDVCINISDENNGKYVPYGG